MLMGLALGIIILITFINVIFGGSFMGSESYLEVENESFVGGESSTFVIEGQSFGFNVDPVIGGMAILTTVVTVAIIFGAQILGSGLSEEAVKTIVAITAYAGIWTLFSLLSWRLINEIETFGYLIYVGLTVMYVVGVITKLVSD